ncbi:hypothetical protein ACSMXN_10760 [Jatrophihabitans sp. DSM 45814]
MTNDAYPIVVQRHADRAAFGPDPVNNECRRKPSGWSDAHQDAMR